MDHIPANATHQPEARTRPQPETSPSTPQNIWTDYPRSPSSPAHAAAQCAQRSVGTYCTRWGQRWTTISLSGSSECAVRRAAPQCAGARRREEGRRAAQGPRKCGRERVGDRRRAVSPAVHSSVRDRSRRRRSGARRQARVRRPHAHWLTRTGAPSVRGPGRGVRSARRVRLFARLAAPTARLRAVSQRERSAYVHMYGPESARISSQRRLQPCSNASLVACREHVISSEHATSKTPMMGDGAGGWTCDCVLIFLTRVH